MKNCYAFIRIFRQLGYVMSKKQKRKAIIVYLCMLLSSALELLGVSSIYPFLQAVLETETLSNEWYFKKILVCFPNITNVALMLIMGILIMTIYICKNLFMLLTAYEQNKFAAEFERENSIVVLNSYLSKTYEFFVNTNSSIILRGINNDVSGVYQILLCGFTILSETLTVVAIGCYLMLSDMFIAICALILALVCFCTIVVGFKRKIKKAGEKTREAIYLSNVYGYQAVNGIKEITVLNRKENFVKKYENAAIMREKASVISGFISACPDRILEGICIAGFMAIVCIRLATESNPSVFIPTLGAFAMGAFRILPSISKISNRINNVIFYKPCLENIYCILKEEEESKQEKTELLYTEFNEQQEICFKEKLEINNIVWKYQNARDNVLNNLSMTIRKGEAIALIGTSGAGKTTLADIIMGLLQPKVGTVEMDGINIFSIPQTWSKIIGYVPQSVFLIDDTVRNNIAFGLEKDSISDYQIWDALEQAQLKEFIETLPDGLDTIVGERGVKFSGGQRQRIAIARALYENPDILVLDEATSALDSETEDAVMEAIDLLQGLKTLIIVAHRLTTIRNCDKIYEIKDGIALERMKDEVFI